MCQHNETVTTGDIDRDDLFIHSGNPQLIISGDRVIIIFGFSDHDHVLLFIYREFPDVILLPHLI